MWQYEKRLEYPVNIKQTDPKTAQYILSQYGGPDGEINASLRYLSQRYSIPYREVAGLLTDIATEEIAHFEMIATIVHQLTRDLTPEEIKASNFGPYYMTTPLPYGHRLPVVFHRMPVNSSLKAIRLLTLWKIWLQSRKPAPLTITFFVS